MAEPLTESQENEGKVLALPASGSAVERALQEMEHVYAFFFVRVGNRPDAEDLTQMVALKSLSRLRDDAPSPSIRGYLFTTARSVLAGFWARRFGLPEDELGDNLASSFQSFGPGDGAAVERVGRILAQLPENYRRVLELRFLRGYSLKEVAAEMATTTGNVKVMQLRALRAAARLGEGPDGL